MANLLRVAVGDVAGGGMSGCDPVGDERRRTLGAVAQRATAQMSGENFPVALRLLPRTARGQLCRVYTFARFVDDVGDEAAGDRSALLAEVESDLHRLVADGRSALAPVTDLGSVLAAGVPVQPFLDLVAANQADQHTSRYETFDDLLGYCRLSAAPVGRIVLHLAGAATERNFADSDAVCDALQVLEHCQDVGEDARAGRIYLPASELRAAGIDDHALTASQTPSALRYVLAVQVERSRALLRAGAPLVRRLSGWSRFAVAGFVAGGLATADALTNADFDVLAADARPAKIKTMTHALRLVTGISR